MTKPFRRVGEKVKVSTTFVIVAAPIRCAVKGVPLSHDELYQAIADDRIPIGSVIERGDGKVLRLNEQMRVVVA
jgi:hypothetical protein